MQRGALGRVDRVDERGLLAARDEVGVVAGAVGQRDERVEQAAVPVDGADEVHVLADGAWLHGHLGEVVERRGLVPASITTRGRAVPWSRVKWRKAAPRAWTGRGRRPSACRRGWRRRAARPVHGLRAGPTLSLVATISPRKDKNTVAGSVCPSSPRCAPRHALLPGVRPGASRAFSTADAKQERRIITTMFCDLVSSRLSASAPTRRTSTDGARLSTRSRASGRAVRRRRREVHQRRRGRSARRPRAHDDDPARALRAALRLLDRIGELPQPCDEVLRARVGIETGEALVRLDIEPGSGEGFHTGTP